MTIVTLISLEKSKKELAQELGNGKRGKNGNR